MTVKEKLSKLRDEMMKHNIDAYIIPSTDPHTSEYVPERWSSRSWISGFTGSAGTVVVTKDKAGLWTDSRYFLQATEQLEDSTIDLFKMGLPDVPSIESWLTKTLNEDDTVGFDGKVFPLSQVRNLEKQIEMKGLNINGNHDLIDSIWQNRPEAPLNEVFEHELKFAGKTRIEKLGEIREKLEDKNADWNLVTTLDDIAWIYNLRGSDVDFNPVFVAYTLIGKGRAILFIDERKLTFEMKTDLENDGIEIKDYVEIAKELKALDKNESIMYDPNKINYWLYNAIQDMKTLEEMNPSTMLKACKNEVEVKGMKAALKRDGAAMVKFIKWVYDTVGNEKVTELSAASKLLDFRQQNDLFVGESFNTISGYGEHGAIIHYAANEETDYEIKPEGFYLIDSGGQYYDGTTDITRMFYLGDEPTEQEKKDYTLVLKGHINIAMAKYPANTRGSQLDAFARKFLWENGLNYLHGTGHGVGCFLNVHEGPQNIRLEENPTVLQEGMINSNEPGVYRSGQYGIRIENLILTTKEKETDFGDFYKFETLTLCPIDTKAIDADMLTKEEKKWFNTYHKQVYMELSAFLDDEHRSWLAEKTVSL
jgi:Xaa-Pro aminopeptidase